MSQEALPVSKRDLVERAELFAVRAIRLFQHLQEQSDRTGWIIGKQLLRSATSVGANLEEGQGAESSADFLHKYRVARKEARESHYWLRLLLRAEVVPEARLRELMDEADQLRLILTTIILKVERKR